jgi:hypothetical protein
LNTKYPIPKTNGLSLMAGVNTVISGRNMGQSTSYNAGLVYQFLVKSKNPNIVDHEMTNTHEGGTEK